MGYGLLLVAAGLNATASVLLKIGADRGPTLNLSQGVVGLLVGNAYLIAGLALFALNVIFYIFALRALPLSVAYPIMIAASFIIVGTVSSVLFSENITFLKAAGYALILLGIVLVVMSTSTKIYGTLS